MTHALAKFEDVAMSSGLSNGSGDTFTRKYRIDLWAKVSQDVIQYPLHHATYADTKFEVATSNELGGDEFSRKYII